MNKYARKTNTKSSRRGFQAATGVKNNNFSEFESQSVHLADIAAVRGLLSGGSQFLGLALIDMKSNCCLGILGTFRTGTTSLGIPRAIFSFDDAWRHGILSSDLPCELLLGILPTMNVCTSIEELASGTSYVHAPTTAEVE
jgi:hypothetical protein